MNISPQQITDRLQRGSLSCGSLGYHSLQPQLWRIACDNQVVAGAGAIALGDPLGGAPPTAQTLKALGSPDFFHISEKTAHTLQGSGYRICRLGAEAIIDLPFAAHGHRKADIRRALNRAARAEVTIREIAAADWVEVADEVRRFNASWLAARPLFRSEFTFLARGYRAQLAPGERRFAAFCDGRLVGFACYDPVWKGGNTVGYLESIIRAQAGIEGARDALTVTALQRFSSERVRFLSLGLCPFHFGDTRARLKLSGITELALGAFYRFGGAIFNSAGLAFHKSRYRPRFEPIYFATRSSLPLLALYLACRASSIDPLRAFRRLPVLSRLVRPTNAAADVYRRLVPRADFSN